MPSTDCWQIVPNSELRVRVWDEECVVFVPSSTDTHFLDAFSASIFSLLSRPLSEVQLVERLTAGTGLAPDGAILERLRTVLAVLSREGIIERVTT